jgi:hypothetical protein
MSGVYIFYIAKTVKFTILSAQGRVWGFVWIWFNLSVKIGKTIAKINTSLGLTLRVTIVDGNLCYITFSADMYLLS